MSDEFEVNDGHYLELMDRLHVIGSNIEDHIMSHPLLHNIDDKELMESLHKTLEGIYESYQRIGKLDYEYNCKDDDTDLE